MEIIKVDSVFCHFKGIQYMQNSTMCTKNARAFSARYEKENNVTKNFTSLQILLQIWVGKENK